jgi:hypothetical protein
MKKSTIKTDDDLSHHILPNSATMVGVCIMVISIVKGMPADTVNYFIDKALAVDCVLFMVSALFSFISIRTETSAMILERGAEVIFVFGLISMTIIAVVFAFEIG